MNGRIALLAWLVATLISACAAPIQSGVIEVRPGAAERLQVLCRFRGGGVQRACVVVDEEPEGRSPHAPSVIRM